MAELTGSEILAKCLKKDGVQDIFYIMGGPMLLAESTCITEGIRMIDVLLQALREDFRACQFRHLDVPPNVIARSEATKQSPASSGWRLLRFARNDS